MFHPFLYIPLRIRWETRWPICLVHLTLDRAGTSKNHTLSYKCNTYMGVPPPQKKKKKIFFMALVQLFWIQTVTESRQSVLQNNFSQILTERFYSSNSRDEICFILVNENFFIAMFIWNDLAPKKKMVVECHFIRWKTRFSTGTILRNWNSILQNCARWKSFLVNNYGSAWVSWSYFSLWCHGCHFIYSNVPHSYNIQWRSSG